MCIDAKATPTNDIDYSCHIKVIELTVFDQSYGLYITPHHAITQRLLYISTNMYTKRILSYRFIIRAYTLHVAGFVMFSYRL